MNAPAAAVRTHNLANIVNFVCACSGRARKVNRAEAAFAKEKTVTRAEMVKQICTDDLASVIDPSGCGTYGAGKVEGSKTASTY